MESTSKITKANYSISNARVDVCVVTTGFGDSVEREKIWSSAAENFIRLMQRHGVNLAVIGPKPPLKFTQKLGLKRSVHFFDRHEVINLKLLSAARSHGVELRLLNRKSKAWVRVRTDACVTVGSFGLWPVPYEGWTAPGTLAISSLGRWVNDYKWVPGREFAFIGSSNQAIRWATTLLDLGAKSCYVIEPGSELKCWRSHRDRFVRKGGRVFLKHELLRAESDDQSVRALYLQNQHGTLILSVDTIILSSTNDERLNGPEQWKQGLYYLQRRYTPSDHEIDEEYWLEDLDWKEVYWRVLKQLSLVDHAPFEGALKGIKADRRRLLEYRRPENRKEITYSGKILDRDANVLIQASPSVPKHLDAGKAVASLECFEKIPCRACADVCPESAISITNIVDLPALIEDKCTGCGACVAVCPAGAAVMVQELQKEQKTRIFLPDDTKELWKPGHALQMLNRRGEVLGIGRTVGPAIAYEKGLHKVLEVEVPNFYLWEARGFRENRLKLESERANLDSAHNPKNIVKKGWVQLNNVRRLCPIDVPVTVALWQLGLRRFEEAFFCGDGACRLCEITVNGRKSLACQTLVTEGQNIEVTLKKFKNKSMVCPCNSV